MINFRTGGPWITRFAPSPTGVLHLGNARTAALNFLLARQSGGKFLLRLEDTDQERSTFASEAAILWSLAWMGLTPDEPVRRQSLGLQRYAGAVRILVEHNLAYPCFCTETELQQEREAAARAGLPPRYSGRCAALSPDECAARLARGDTHSIRFRNTRQTDIHFTDLIKGQITVPATAFGDFVLLRSSGWPSYNLAVVVDDIDMGVNLVLRGEDHLTNTARQILLYSAFESPPPVFAHHGLLVDSEGKKLSKRSGALSIPECMDTGLEPLALVQYLASLSGALPTKHLFTSLEDMARSFNPFALGRGNAIMNFEELHNLSARYFRATAPRTLVSAVSGTLPPTDPWHDLEDEIRCDLVSNLRDNATTLRELCNLLPHFTTDRTCYTPASLTEIIANTAVLSALNQALDEHDPASRLDKSMVTTVLHRTSEQTGSRGRALYHPIRLALTGQESGPELLSLLSLMPVGRIKQRVREIVTILSHCNHKE